MRIPSDSPEANISDPSIHYYAFQGNTTNLYILVFGCRMVWERLSWGTGNFCPKAPTSLDVD
jgi:hypothetical protein